MKRALTLMTAFAVMASAASAQAESTYVVLYKQQAVPADAAATIAKSGGTLVQGYDAIGVAIARSSSSTFAADIAKNAKVDVAESTKGFGVQIAGKNDPPGDNAPVADADEFTGLQWDMRQIDVPQAHAITGGSPSIIVGDIDTGLDKDHPDLQPNIDYSRSVSCLGGVPNTDPAAWDDDAGHGTHTAGTIAAAANGFGIEGVAPNVKIAGIKAGNQDGYFFPDAVICSFYWAATHGIQVTNNSYFADPYLYNCKNDPTQRAIWQAEQRAIKFAQKQGVAVIAAEGNEADDLRHPQVDNTSPDYPPGQSQSRTVNNDCIVIPVEIPGVIGVSATGSTEQTDDDGDADYLKSFYSSYGEVDVAAPGGDSRFFTPESVNGRVLSTWPAEIACPRRQTSTVNGSLYCYAQGTSMASPHVAGVAALIESVRGPTKPEKVRDILRRSADAQPCPSALTAAYLAFKKPSGDDQACYGGKDDNAWYGKGQVNALAAITVK